MEKAHWPHFLEDSKKRLDQVAPAFCLAKWLQTTLLLQNGIKQSCHHADAEKLDIEEVTRNPYALHNTKHHKEIRKMILNGHRPKECSYCWHMERVGQISDRIIKSSSYWAKPYWDRVIKSGSSQDITPSYLEVAFSNACNLACAYCHPQSSSVWLKEVKTLGPYPTSHKYRSLHYLEKNHIMPVADEEQNPYIKAFWNWWPFLKENLRIFRISGGEPLLARSTWRIFDDLINSPNQELELEVNSNFCLPVSTIERFIERVNDLDQKIKTFILHVSIDTVGKQAEYIRYGLDVDCFFSNVDLFLEKIKWPVTLNYMITVNALSIFGLEQLLKVISHQRIKYPQRRILIDFPYLKNPEFLSLRILPEKFRYHFSEIVEYMKKQRELTHVFSDEEIVKVRRLEDWAFEKSWYLSWRQKKLQKDFLRFICEYDKRKGLNSMSLFDNLLKTLG